MEPQYVDRRLTTILAADVVGYSRLLPISDGARYSAGPGISRTADVFGRGEYLTSCCDLLSRWPRYATFFPHARVYFPPRQHA